MPIGCDVKAYMHSNNLRCCLFGGKYLLYKISNNVALETLCICHFVSKENNFGSENSRELYIEKI